MSRRPPDPKWRIIYEDDDILVADKPAGLLTSTGPREKRATLLGLVADHVKSRRSRAEVGLIHRLDRDASGLLVFSKNPIAFSSLKGQFFKHTVERIYHAIVDGGLSPPNGRIESRLVEMVKDGTVRTSRNPRKGERAITHYQTLKTFKNRSLLLVRLETGRKHQIRVHFSENGAPIVNDPLYNPANRTGRLMLAATKLVLTHPRNGKRMTFEIDLPREMQHLLPRINAPRSSNTPGFRVERANPTSNLKTRR